MSPRRDPTDVTDAELSVLKTLWEGGPATVREVLARVGTDGREWAYTTVQTLLLRLQEKGCVRADKRGLAHVFAATVTRDQLAGQQIDHVKDSILDGAAAPLVLRLVQNGRFSAAEIADFRRLLDEAEKRSKGGERR
jgi:BlaI family transcriptional regulator, penicillinase repressor